MFFYILRGWTLFLILSCTYSRAALAFAEVGSRDLLVDQQSSALLDDSRAQVSIVSIPPGGEYVMIASTPKGSIWVVMDGPGIALSGAGGVKVRNLSPGNTGKLGPGRSVHFRNSAEVPRRLLIVNVKKSFNIVMAETLDLTPGNSMEDASPHGYALLVALSVLKLRDVWDLGDDEHPVPSKSEVISMRQADVGWLRPGMHTLTNLLGTTERFVMIEW